MAITRCPYCHAIIDENDKYCNNCGTQLLFSEDEEIEEEIPGEKIIEAEAEEKDYSVDEPEDEKRPASPKDLDSDIDEELKGEFKPDTRELPLEALVAEEEEALEGDEGEDEEEGAGDVATEEVILVDEIEAAEAGERGSLEKPWEEEEPAEVGAIEEDREEEDETESLEPEEEAREFAPTPVIPETTAEEPVGPPVEAESASDLEDTAEDEVREETATIPVIPAVPVPVTFDTKELEGIGRTVELSKEKVEKFIEIMAEKKVEEPVEEPPPPKAAAEQPTGTLPPWASMMKGAPVFPDETGPVGAPKAPEGAPPTPAADEEVEIFPRRRRPDSTIGLPERVSQAPLPFETEAVEEIESEEEEGEREVREEIVLPAGQVRLSRQAAPAVREPELGAAEAAEEIEEAVPRPPFSISVFLKSKAFDVLFVGLFWLVALWLAASSMGLTLFEVLGSMSVSMVLLYAVLILLYFFLFKFFLGETLGDRLFRPRE